jgi:hypothetical protein
LEKIFSFSESSIKNNLCFLKCMKDCKCFALTLPWILFTISLPTPGIGGGGEKEEWWRG